MYDGGDVGGGAKQEEQGNFKTSEMTFCRVILSSIRPLNVVFHFRMKTPDCETKVRGADHSAHALGSRIESWMPQKPFDEFCCKIISNLQTDNAISFMTKCVFIKPLVQREKGRTLELKQKRDNLFVLNTLSSHVKADLAYRYSPVEQKLSLIFEDIFIQNVHTGVGSGARSSTCLRNAWLAKDNASAIAS